MNKTDAMNNNKAMFCELMEQSKENGNLVKFDNMYILQLDSKLIKMDISTGRYLDTNAGNNKANKRAHVNINGYMCADYNFKVVCDGLFEESLYSKYKLYRDGKKTYRLFTPAECKKLGYKVSDHMIGPCVDNTVVNHKDGDTENNTSDNLEVVTIGMNDAHGRLMAEIYTYYADTLVSREYNVADKCYMYKCLGFSISCNDIERYNSINTKHPILAFKDKKEEFRPRFTKEEIDNILEFLGIESNKKNAQTMQNMQVKINLTNDRLAVYDF